MRSENLTPAPLVLDTMKSGHCLHTTYINTHFTYPISLLSSRNSKNPKLKEHYKLHCKLLSKVIKQAKILQYKKHILTSYNKTRTTWNIVKSKTGKKRKKEEISLLNVNGKLI